MGWSTLTYIREDISDGLEPFDILGEGLICEVKIRTNTRKTLSDRMESFICPTGKIFVSRHYV